MPRRRAAWKALFFPSLVILVLLYLLRSPGVYPSNADIPDPVLVLTAHPDDECMFFSPTILALKKQGKDVRGLCLSVGNADGLGPTRRAELVQSYEVLGVEGGKVKVLDHPELQDDITRAWNTTLITAIVEEYVRQHRIASIITFDAHGISSHPNHISLFHGARHFSSPSRQSSGPSVWALHTTGLVAKYTGYLGAAFAPSVGRSDRKGNRIVFASGVEGYVTALRAMRAHWTQLVWFRWLYVGWSRYMWVNELREVV